MPTCLPYTNELVDLLREGAIALAEVESNGMAVNTDYIDLALRRTKRRVERRQAELEEMEVMKTWRKTFRNKTNLNSAPQLGHVLFDVMGYPPPKRTSESLDSGYATDEATLMDVDDPFVQQFLSIKKLNKAVNTNLKGILREVVNGRIHCFFNLHTVETYRSSSDSFNFTNLPVRDPEIADLIRTAFVPYTPDDQICEVDFSGAEVVVAACYHKDPVMIDYILDESKDMHRDTAMELYHLPLTEFLEKQPDGTFKKFGKEIRHAAKNQFVFPQFYGDWYMHCTPSLWKSAGRLKLRDGTPLQKHLARVGIKEMGDLEQEDGKPKPPRKGTLELQVQQTEQSFWTKRFKVYSQWKKEWVEEYRQKGHIEILTGFVCQGLMRKNEVINYPVQGSAFHCLLWALIRIVRKELKRRKMKTKIVGQIHDSIVANVAKGELDDYLAICKHVMTVLILKRFPWLIAPMKIEAEVAPPGASWADKRAYDIKA